MTPRHPRLLTPHGRLTAGSILSGNPNPCSSSCGFKRLAGNQRRTLHLMKHLLLKIHASVKKTAITAVRRKVPRQVVMPPRLRVPYNSRNYRLWKWNTPNEQLKIQPKSHYRCRHCSCLRDSAMPILFHLQSAQKQQLQRKVPTLKVAKINGTCRKYCVVIMLQEHRITYNLLPGNPGKFLKSSLHLKPGVYIQHF